MALSEQQENSAPEFNYHLLRIALESFGRNLRQLEPNELKEVCAKATKSFELESLVLSSEEAKRVVISDQQLNRAVAEVEKRYNSRDDFLADLSMNSLDESTLRSALYRELMFDGTMQVVSASSSEVTDLDVSLFYQMHQDRFEQPELRQARHILITINPDFPENTPEEANKRIETVVEKLAGRTNRFADFAKRFSECPTAMEGGKLGDVKKGQLFPELDAMLFTMQEQELSPVIESEIGYHILFCEKIKQAKKTPLSKVKDRIRDVLIERRRHNVQKAWLNSLKNSLQ